MKIKLIKFKEDLIKPTRAHYNDAGIDCYAQEDIILPAFRTDYSEENIDDEDLIKYDSNNPNKKEDTDYPFDDIEEIVGVEYSLTSKAIPTLIPLGFGLEVPDGYMATIRPRSSYNVKGVISQIGTIDSGYRGEIKAVLINLTSKPISIKKGEKICQIVIEPVILAEFVEELTNDRKDGGFGSTGK